MKLLVKIPLIYTVLIIAIGVAFIVFTSTMVENHIAKEEQEHLESLTKTFALNSANAIVIRDYAALRSFVDNMPNGGHMVYAIILDENESVLAHSRHEFEGKALTDPVSLKAAASRDLLVQAIGSDIVDVAAPLMIAGKKWGAVRIGFSLAEIKIKAAKARNIILFAGLTATLLGIVASILIAKKITDPIHKLHKGTDIISEGNLDYRLDISTGDEIEQLAKAFNAMTGHLQKNYMLLSESEERFRNISASAHDAIIMIDNDGNISYWNKAAERIFGYSTQEATGKECHMFLAPERFHEAYRKGFAKFKETGAGFAVGKTLELAAVRNDGTKFPIELSISAIKVKGKWNAIGILRDVTKRKQAKEEIENLASRLDTVIEHMPQGVFLLNRENRIIHANHIGINCINQLEKAKIGDALTRIGGHPVKELLISPPLIMWHEIEMKEPPHLIFEVAGRALKDDSGTVFVIRDITEEKKSEEKIHSQERLASVGHLAAGIAHDFNNFLTGIIGYADLLLLDTNLNLYPETKQMAESISESGRSAANLIRQILDFSRKSVSEIKLLDLKPFIKEIQKMIRTTVPENIRVSYSIGEGEYMVKADLTKMQQMLMNLAVNAGDAMPEGGELKFGLSHIQITDNPPFPGMPLGDWIAVTVSDTGIGIPPQALPHIFEPFFTTKETGRGTGLGLAQVYGIVKQHDGYIEVKTEVGRGAAFIIYLPPSKAEEEITSMEKETIIPKGGGETILIIEDNHSVRDFLNRALIELGYKVLTAKDGKEGLNIFDGKYGEIGLIITDMIMPEMGGIELSREIKRKKPSVRILGITGYDFSAKKEEIINAGIEEMLQKPFNLEELAQTVANALG